VYLGYGPVLQHWYLILAGGVRERPAPEILVDQWCIKLRPWQPSSPHRSRTDPAHNHVRVAHRLPTAAVHTHMVHGKPPAAGAEHFLGVSLGVSQVFLLSQTPNFAQKSPERGPKPPWGLGGPPSPSGGCRHPPEPPRPGRGHGWGGGFINTARWRGSYIANIEHRPHSSRSGVTAVILTVLAVQYGAE
jgi:hypothetical protein